MKTIRSNAMLQQILLRNLVDNAIRYSPPRTEVIIRVGISANQTIWLEVSDQGPGIKPEDRHHITGHAFIEETKPSQDQAWGFSIVLRIVTLLGGQLSLLDRDPPPGLTVRVVLPA
jgi:signal transduction histidine kinase